MLLLAGPQLSDDVASTAAAILAERAAEHCCCRLRSQVGPPILPSTSGHHAFTAKEASWQEMTEGHLICDEAHRPCVQVKGACVCILVLFFCSVYITVVGAIYDVVSRVLV